eukprot:scaffold132197_cov32-Tisochrysis_lutea.AAC.3
MASIGHSSSWTYVAKPMHVAQDGGHRHARAPTLPVASAVTMCMIVMSHVHWHLRLLLLI